MNWTTIISFTIVIGQVVASFALIISFVYILKYLFTKKEKRDKKKGNIAVIVFLVFLLIAIFSSGALKNTKPLTSDDEKDSTIIDLRGLKNQNSETGDTFEKKKECSNYIKDIEREISLFNQAQVPEYRNSNNTGGVNMNLYKEVKAYKEVFYSPTLNTCVSLTTLNTLMKTTFTTEMDAEEKIYWKPIYSTFHLLDLLTGKEIEQIQFIHRGEQFNSFKEIEEKIKKYK